ncbi:MAG: reverse transcriptase family protein [Gammaproteobacteria bacterium]
MSYQRLFISALADILLAGEWLPRPMLERAAWLLQAEPLWAATLVKRIYAKYKTAFPDVTKKQLVEFIANDSQFAVDWRKYREELRLRRFSLEPTPEPAAKLTCDIPPLHNFKELAAWLGLSLGQLDQYAGNRCVATYPVETRFRHYHYHWKPKKGGQPRLIEAPKQRIADVQRQIYLGILEHIPLHEACHGFRKRHSCRTYVAHHAGKSVVIRMDLENFFVSVPLRRIHALFTAIGYREAIARRLAGLCCNQTPPDVLGENPQLTWLQRKQLMTPHLPQGAPSSPVLANLCAYKLDVRLSALAKKIGGEYTRYADDLAFSGNAYFAGVARYLPVLVAHIAATEGFSVNHRKTRIMSQSVSQRLTGMTLNRFPNCMRKDYDRLKAILYNCIRFGPRSQNSEKLPDFKAHLYGRIAFMRSLNPQKAGKLERLYEKIMWTEN